MSGNSFPTHARTMTSTKPGLFKTPDMYHFAPLEAGSLRSRGRQGRALSDSTGQSLACLRQLPVRGQPRACFALWAQSSRRAAVFPCHVFMQPSPWPCLSLPRWPLWNKHTAPMGSGPSPSDHIFSFTSSLKIFIFKYSLTLRSWGFRTSTYECQQWRTRVQPITGYLFLVIML